ncbi:MAG: ABC transporter permease [Muribaculum sp.]|nr:ABC transporter permease [Muribaculum sp.]
MNRNRLSLILQREYLAIVGKKSFIISTLLVPVAMILLTVLPAIINNLSSSEIKTVAIIDQTGLFVNSFQDNDEYRFVTPDSMTVKNMKEEFRNSDGALYAIVVIPSTIDRTKTVNIYSDKTVKMSLDEEVENVLSEAMTTARIESYNIPELNKIIAESKVEVDVKSYTWSDDSENSSSAGIAMAVGVGLALLTYFFVLMYGAMIMSSVVEDKTNRIVEVIVSSCRPFELLMGKVIALALVGLTQILIWVILIVGGVWIMSLFSLININPADAVDSMAMAQGAQASVSELQEITNAIFGINWLQLISVFVLYFIGGYLLYASLFAGVGSAVDQQSEASQFMSPLMMIIILAYMVGMSCMQDPDTALCVWCSYIPFTSPIVMMVRLPYDVAAWEVAISIILLYATALVCVWIASRIYRTGILMYGHKVSWKEMLSWIKR